MATTLITGSINAPDGTPIPGVKVAVTLRPRPAFETITGFELSGTTILVSNGSGQYAVNLIRTADITPAGSFYEVTEYIPDRHGGPVTHRIQVGASPSTVYGSVVAVPQAPASPSYLTQTAADARYVQSPGSFGGASVPSRPNTAGTAGVATTYARSDHSHSREVTYGTDAARTALTGDQLYDGHRFAQTTSPYPEHVYRNGAWIQDLHAFYVADAAGLAALTVPPGTRAYQNDTASLKLYTATGWWTVGHGSAALVTTFLPVLQQGVTIVARSATSSYRIVDGVCEWWFVVSPLASAAPGGVMTLTLPVPSLIGSPSHVGAGEYYDASASTIDALSFEITSASAIGWICSRGTNNLFGATPSIPVSAGDSIRGHVRYPIASAA